MERVNPQKAIEARAVIIKDILENLEIDTPFDFYTDNYQAWRSAFNKKLDRYNKNERVIDKSFSIRKTNVNNSYTIWRNQ